MIRYVFLVALFCWGVCFVCLAEEGNGEEKKKDWICPQCHGTNEADCVSCLGTGMEITKCTRCKATGICLSCKGEGLILCKYCKGEGEISCNNCNGEGYKRIRLRSRDGQIEEDTIVCSSCKGECKIICRKCKGKGAIACKSCKETGECSKCLGIGIIRKKGGCRNCKGTGKVKCRYCESKGKIDNAKIMSHKDVAHEIIKTSINLEKATELQEERIKRIFVAKWNRNIAGKIIKWEGIVGSIGKGEVWQAIEVGKDETEVNTNIIDLDLFSDKLSLGLWIPLIWEEQLLNVSAKDTIVFLIILPRAALTTHSYYKIITFGGDSAGITFSPESPSLDLKQVEQPVPVTLIGYKKKWQEELKEFTPPSK